MVAEPVDGDRTAPAQRPQVSSAMEDYLKAIFELGGKEVKTNDLAAALSVSPASVTGMVQKLAGLKLLDYERYRGVSLTDAGRLMALETLRHHRLIEAYLAQALGYGLHEVHDEAERLEHVISEDFEDRITELLGDPTHDPHGDPIPRRDGSLPESPGQPLSAWPLAEPGVVSRVTDQDREVLAYLSEQGLVPGRRVAVVARQPLDGPLTVVTGGGTTGGGGDTDADAERVLAFRLAKAIMVRPLRPADEEGIS